MQQKETLCVTGMKNVYAMKATKNVETECVSDSICLRLQKEFTIPISEIIAIQKRKHVMLIVVELKAVGEFVILINVHVCVRS